MIDVLPTIDEWRTRGERIAIATVVKTLGSAPRGIGAKMVVSASGAMAGSVNHTDFHLADTRLGGSKLRKEWLLQSEVIFWSNRGIGYLDDAASGTSEPVSERCLPCF